MVRRAFAQLHFVFQLHCSWIRSSVHIYFLVTSRLNYFSVLYMGLPLSIHKLQLLQKAIGQTVICVSGIAIVTLLLHELHYCQLVSGFNRRCWPLKAFKDLHGMGWGYLRYRLFSNISAHSVSLGREGKLWVLSTRNLPLGGL